ncbi:MAG: LptA/OstA family protein [Verrucomicrobiales bacterium]
MSCAFRFKSQGIACRFLAITCSLLGWSWVSAQPTAEPITEPSWQESAAAGTAEPAPTPPPAGTAPAAEATPASTPATGDEEKKASPTEIRADDEVEFINEEKKAIFRGNVRVRDPEFFLTSDELTVFLEEQGGGMSRAVATGNVRILKVRVEDGKRKVARGIGRHLDYDATTGRAVLTGRPQVQEGFNLHIAEDDSTVMILNRDGRLTTEGKARVVFQPEEPKVEEAEDF